MRNRSIPVMSRIALAAALSLAAAGAAHAANRTWTNAGGNSVWNNSNSNWSGASWDSLAGDGAIFGATGAGALMLDGMVKAGSLHFQSNGYVLNGGTLALGNGSSSLITSIANPPAPAIAFKQVAGSLIAVDPGVTARINSAISATSQGLIKTGGGTLELAGPLSFSGNGLDYLYSGLYTRFTNDLTIYGVSQASLGGTVKIMNESVLPSTTRVAVGNGQLDLGANNVTLDQLTFINQGDKLAWDPATGASPVSSVIGAGTLRVTGEIIVRGVSAGNDGANQIATNLDLGGGTQVVRVSANSSFMQSRGLQFTGVLSNGSFLKTTGPMENGVPGTPDGVSLFGNNTYTGSTVFNSGVNLVTGTNASSSVKIHGSLGPAGGGQLILAGANGSYGAADSFQASAGGILYIDNTFTTVGYVDAPQIAAANNNNRIKDTAEVQLRDGSFYYKGASNTASSETFGKLNVSGGHNVVNLMPTGTGTVTLTAAGGLEMGSRATMQIASTTLGGSSKLFVGGATPAADSTGILTRIIGSSDFLTYNATTGFTPLAAGSYAANSFAAGANVALTAASTLASSTSINALKRMGSFTTTIADGQTLAIASGMILNASGTATFSGGTVAFGDAPGAIMGAGSVTLSSAVTGTQGLINSVPTLTLSGNLSGLSGTITNNTTTSTLNLNTNTFGGKIEVRGGQLAINVSQTLAGQGAITLGVKENEVNLIGNIPSISLSGLGANGVMGRDIIVDNGGQNVAGMDYWSSQIPGLSVLGNSSGSQTVSGNVVLNSPLRLQGGGASKTNTGATNFTGNFSGSSYLYVVNGRVNFTGDVSNTGGFTLGSTGGSTVVNFLGTASGNAPMTIIAGSGAGNALATRVAYMPGALPGGDITARNGYGANAPVLVPLATSTINNKITVTEADLYASVGSGITATWNGQVTTDASGYLVKEGAGTLVLNHAANRIQAVQVNGGSVLLNGGLAGLGVAVNSGGTLGGTGNIAGEISVAAGGTVSAGASVGTLTAGSLTLAGTMLAEIDGTGADLLNLTSSFSINGGSLQVAISGNVTGGTYLLATLGGSSAISGTFASVLGLPSGYSYSIDYAFAGTDALGRIGDGNDLALSVTAAVPEPSSYAMFLAGGALLIWLGRRRRPAA